MSCCFGNCFSPNESQVIHPKELVRKKDFNNSNQQTKTTQKKEVDSDLIHEDIAALVHFRIDPVFIQNSKQNFPSPFVKYIIVPYENQKKCLDVCTTKMISRHIKRNQMIIWNYHGGPNQQFYLSKRNSHQYYIINVSKGFTVEIPDHRIRKHKHVIADCMNGSQNQLWQILPTDIQNVYSFRSFEGKYLTVDGFMNACKVITAEWNGSHRQKWKILTS